MGNDLNMRGDGTDAEYVVIKDGYYYRPGSAGYTKNIAEAGRYTLAEAVKESHPNGRGGPRDGLTYERAPVEPTKATADEAEWLPMSDAPRDGTVILGRTRSDMPEDESLPQWSAHRWNDRYVPMKHEGRTPNDYDLGWSVALPVGHGGLPDDWFIGWKPLTTQEQARG